MGTLFVATHTPTVVMKCFAVLSSLLVVVAAEAEADAYYGYGGHGLGYGGYGGHGYAGAYRAAIRAPVAYAAAPVAYARSAVVQAVAPVVQAVAPVVQAVAPVVQAAAPVAYAAPVAAPLATISTETPSSQYRSEDEAGNTAYGYQNINNAAEQRGTGNGRGVAGSYSFRDEAGYHSVSYVADSLGYRITGRSKRSVGPIAPVAYAGVAAPTAYAAYAAPASREAVLTTIQLNPGHATFYRVD